MYRSSIVNCTVIFVRNILHKYIGKHSNTKTRAKIPSILILLDFVLLLGTTNRKEVSWTKYIHNWSCGQNCKYMHHVSKLSYSTYMYATGPITEQSNGTLLGRCGVISCSAIFLILSFTYVTLSLWKSKYRHWSILDNLHYLLSIPVNILFFMLIIHLSTFFQNIFWYAVK